MKTVALLRDLRRLLPTLALALVLTAWALPARAQGSGAPASPDLQSGFDDPLPGGGAGGPPGTSLEGGFSDAFKLTPAPGGEAASEAPAEPALRFWELDGFLRLDGAYNYAHKAPAAGETDFRGLSKLRTAVQLELMLNLARKWRAFVSGQANRDFAYQLHKDRTYAPAVLDRYQQETELREAYVLGTPLPSLDVKIGRQIVVWGKSDTIRVVDVLNPLDLREPGLTDLEDLRLPVTMSKISYYAGPWGLTGIAVHEIRFNKEPVPGSDFFPSLPPPFTTLPREEVPKHGDGNTEWAASLSGIFTGWDLGLYAASVFNDEATVVIPGGNPANAVRRHTRLHMVGAAANVALGNWLLKSELARFSGLRFTNVPGQDFIRADAMVGVEYSGITDATVNLEAVDRHLFDFVPALSQAPDLQGEDINQYALSYRASYLREKLNVVLVLSAYGAHAEQGTVQRYQATYELAQALNGTLGVIVYTPGKGNNVLLANARNNDRLFFELKWSF